MIASLPMYWTDANAQAHARFWRIVQEEGSRNGLDLPDLTAPDALPDRLEKYWLSPDLALSMTCGLPLRTILRDRVTYVGTFDCRVKGCAAGYYRSVAVARRAHPLPSVPMRLAYNAPDSQSGWAAAEEWRVDPAVHPVARDWADKLETGAHAASAQAVAAGDADIAFLDAVTWRILQRHAGWTRALRVIGHTRPTPGLPLVTARSRDPEPLRRVLTRAIAAADPADLSLMGGLRGLKTFESGTYYALPIPPAP